MVMAMLPLAPVSGKGVVDAIAAQRMEPKAAPSRQLARAVRVLSEQRSACRNSLCRR